MEPTKDSAADQPKKKNLKETLLTTTPVVLTVLGTLLAGVSTSEMTLAQYFRTLAAQSQSKAADQWQFFQVKRIRGTSLETTLDLMPVPAPPGPLDAALLLNQSGRLQGRLRQAAQAAEQFRAAAGKSDLVNGAPEDRRRSLLQQFAAVATTAAECQQEAARVGQLLRDELSKPETRTALQLIQEGQLPKVEIRPLGDPAIQQAMDGVRRVAPQAEMAPLLLQIQPDAVDAAIHAVERNYHDVEGSSQSVRDALGRIEQLTNRQVAQVRTFHKAVLNAENALAGEAAAGKSANPLPAELADLQRLDRDLLLLGTELNQALKSALHYFTALRYRKEAEYNQQAALLYEVQVRKESVQSDRHRGRSKLFFYAMLCAQAGVAIASLSLAGRQQGLLWTLAVIAGLTAVGFSGYVYLLM